MALNPIRIFKQDAGEEKAELARMSNFVGAIAIGDLVKTTLGPKGMDKILVDQKGYVQVTNDGATILRSIGVDNAAAKILKNMAIVQDNEVGDGTTTVTVLAAELLREAEHLIEKKFHPQTIIIGYRKATEIAIKTLQESSILLKEDEQFIDELMKIAMTSLSSKIVALHKELFSKLAVNAVLRLKGSGNLNAIQIIKKIGGCLSDSFLDEGFLLDKKIGQHQPKKIEKARILIANTPMDADKIKVFGSRVKTDSLAQMANLEVAEREKMKAKVNNILKHKCNVFINRQLIYNYPEQLFADAGVMAIEHADFDGIERLALVTGGEIASTFDRAQDVKLGECESIEEIIIGEDKLLRFNGVALGEACTIVIRGATQQIVDEAERSVHDALCVLSATVKDKRVIYGGGAPETKMALAITEAAVHIPGKESTAMESYANALLQIPTIILDNGGYDSNYLIPSLRSEHRKGAFMTGLDLTNGELGCMKKLGVLESYFVKKQIIFGASEASEIILRVDDIITAAPRKRDKDNRRC